MTWSEGLSPEAGGNRFDQSNSLSWGSPRGGPGDIHAGEGFKKNLVDKRISKIEQIFPQFSAILSFPQFFDRTLQKPIENFNI